VRILPRLRACGARWWSINWNDEIMGGGGKSMSRGLISMKRNSKKCWILKTTSGGLLKNDHWEQFNTENVVAVGWGNLHRKNLSIFMELRRQASLNST
jgi:hypothetical protein